MPTRAMQSARRTRRLKKAEREADFFFINDYDVDWSFSVKRRLERSRHQTINTLCVVAQGFIGSRNFGKLFFKFFAEQRTGILQLHLGLDQSIALGQLV